MRCDISTRSKGMFWTCNELCTANRKEFKRRQKTYLDLNEAYLKGEANVRSMGCVLTQLALLHLIPKTTALFLSPLTPLIIMLLSLLI